ncbi:hypothetical protein CR513_48066, partial [Mucuna pruriens]
MKKDFVTCYNIESKIFNSRQETLSIIKYYGTLNELLIDSIAYIVLVERGRIFKFLGLNSKYDPIQLQILGKEKPPLFEVFFIVWGEETR